MDPVTAIFTFANTVAQIVLLGMQSQPADVKAKMWEDYMQDMEAWRGFWSKLGLSLPAPTIPPSNVKIPGQ